MRKLSQIWFEIQEVLFPFIEKETEEPLTKKLKQLISVKYPYIVVISYKFLILPVWIFTYKEFLSIGHFKSNNIFIPRRLHSLI